MSQSGAAPHTLQNLADFVWALDHAKRLGVRALLRRFPSGIACIHLSPSVVLGTQDPISTFGFRRSS